MGYNLMARIAGWRASNDVPSGPFSDPSDRTNRTVETFKQGETVEGYRIINEVGRGAASIIYAVQDPKSKQVWAMKHVIKEAEKDERFIEQAEYEYQIGVKLQHPCLRRIERLITKKPGFLSKPNEIFMIMELVDGQSVETRRPEFLHQALDIFEKVARALTYMHEKGFIHADMKPNNIMVDSQGTVKVIDLGQSCAAGTVKKRIQGTPDYIAPEQVHRRPITAKTDIYNLGATMYWAFTNKFVPTALGRGDSLMGQIDDTLLEKPKRLIELNKRIPEIIDNLVMSCVEVEPARRPDSMAAVADRLNLIRAKILAEMELRKSGSFRRVDD